MQPQVSVIVATCRRPHLVGRATRSVLAQTLGALELLVVQDGLDRETEAVLAAIADPRLRVVRLPERGGHPRALNAGIAVARAPWIALLDDDDEWLPEKLERQLAAARASRHAVPLVSCRFIARSESGDRVWPRRVPGKGEALGDYLFRRRELAFGEGLLLNSTLLAPAALFRRRPFDSTLTRHADLDWVLCASAEPGFGVEFVPGSEPLAIWHCDVAHARISSSPDWHFSSRWIERRRGELTPAAYAAFLLDWVAANAVRQGDRRALAGIALRALRRGRPDARALVRFLGIALLPRGARERLAARIAGDRSRAAAGARSGVGGSVASRGAAAGASISLEPRRERA